MPRPISPMTLTSTGVEWDEDSLAKRYAFFRKVRNEVRLDLLYYPYWVIELHGRATWRFFGQKAVAMLLVSDARSGRCLRISAPPVLCEEHILPSETEEESPFFPAELKSGSGSSVQTRAHIAPALHEEDAVIQTAETFALSAWNRRYNLPLGPRADIACTEKKALFLHKPFWIMTMKEAQTAQKEKMFIFDASTGLGGLSEYWNVAEYAMSLRDSSAASSHSTSPSAN